MTRQSTDTEVLALVGAFGNGLNVFEKLKKKKRKRTKLHQAQARGEDEEGRLRRSLRQGPIDIHEKYSQSYSLQGERFREGDCKRDSLSLWKR
jgi:hypothetical protein